LAHGVHYGLITGLRRTALQAIAGMYHASVTHRSGCRPASVRMRRAVLERAMSGLLGAALICQRVRAAEGCARAFG
jgi:hypothetical protein